MQERAQIKWLKEGDRNTSYFHKMVNIKHAKTTIWTMEISVTLCRDQTAIKEHIRNFYQKFFSNGKTFVRNSGIIKDLVPQLVTNEENAYLTAALSDAEVRGVVFSLNVNSAPGPYRFNDFFFFSTVGRLLVWIYARVSKIFSTRDIF